MAPAPYPVAVSRRMAALRFLRSCSSTRHMSSSNGNRFAAAVVGAGPAGIAAVGNLLEHVDGPVLWVDNRFRGGRINEKYREVPSNTKVRLFLEYARAVDPFRRVERDAPTPNGISALEGLPGDDTCSLSYAGDMLQTLTDGLRKHERVTTARGRWTRAAFDETAQAWDMTVNVRTKQQQHAADMLVLCTGSVPKRALALPPHFDLDLDLALKPSALAAALPRARPVTVGVLGGSHSGVLVLMNLVALARSSHPRLHIRWIVRHPATLRYAGYRPDGQIVYDNTGLKGLAAEFARREGLDLDASRWDLSHPLSGIVERVVVGAPGEAETEARAVERAGRGCGFFVQAVGFQADRACELLRRPGEWPRDLQFNHETGGLVDAGTWAVQFDHETGGFVDAGTKERVGRLYGAGIAFPERVVDCEGHVEHAVGFFKFMRFLKRVVPSWVAESRPR